MSRDNDLKMGAKHPPSPQPPIPDPRSSPTLCLPDQEKSCFSCCPPIRPASYDHMEHKPIMERILRENTSAFDSGKRDIRAITGYSCWALGYIDGDHKQVGCLLHPGRNGGEDLRYRVGYENKCARETCPEAREFIKLGPEARHFWLGLCRGLDAFAYSSRRFNPLFNLVGWGAELMGLVASTRVQKVLEKDSLYRLYPFFKSRLNPKTHAYLLLTLVRLEGLHLLRQDQFRKAFETFSRRLSEELAKTTCGNSDAPHAHLLMLDPLFLDYLRLSVGIRRIKKERAVELKRVVDRALEEFLEVFER